MPNGTSTVQQVQNKPLISRSNVIGVTDDASDRRYNYAESGADNGDPHGV